jgi:hypothetical protein
MAHEINNQFTETLYCIGYYDEDIKKVKRLFKSSWYENFEQNTQTGVDESVFIGDGYDVYEQACEVALKYCLEKLI